MADKPINRSENASRPWTGSYHPRPNGRSYWAADCPFCGWRQEISAWSVRGTGARCKRPDCRAMFNGWGECHPVEGQEERQPNAR